MNLPLLVLLSALTAAPARASESPAPARFKSLCELWLRDPAYTASEVFRSEVHSRLESERRDLRRARFEAMLEVRGALVSRNLPAPAMTDQAADVYRELPPGLPGPIVQLARRAATWERAADAVGLRLQIWFADRHRLGDDVWRLAPSLGDARRQREILFARLHARFAPVFPEPAFAKAIPLAMGEDLAPHEVELMRRFWTATTGGLTLSPEEEHAVRDGLRHINDRLGLPGEFDPFWLPRALFDLRRLLLRSAGEPVTHGRFLLKTFGDPDTQRRIERLDMIIDVAAALRDQTTFTEFLISRMGR